MADFPIVRSQRTLPEAGPDVRMDMAVSQTGQAQLARAFTQFGGTIMDLGQRFAMMQADTQLSEAKLKARQEINNLSLELDKNPDSDTYTQEYQNTLSKIRTYQPKNGVAAREYEQWINNMSPNWDRAIENSRQIREISNYKAKDIKLFNLARQTGNFLEYRTSILKGQRLNVYSPEDAETLLHDADMQEVFSRAMSMPFNEGMSYIKSADILTVNEQQSLADDLEFKNRIAEEELKAEQEKNYKDFQTRIWNNELTDISEIRQSYLSNDISETQMNNLENDLKNPDVETDDAAYMKVEDAILDYGSGRKTREEVEEIFDKNLTKINKKDKTQLSKKLSSERDKYLDNQTKTGHKIISNILFSSMGSSIYDEVTGEINWAKLISGGKATAEEIAAYRRGTLIFNEWFNKLVDEKKTPKEEDVIFQALKIGNQVKRESAMGQISKTLTDMQPNKSRALNVPNSIAMTFAIPSEQNLPTIKEGDTKAFKKLPKGAEFYYKGRKRTKN